KRKHPGFFLNPGRKVIGAAGKNKGRIPVGSSKQDSRVEPNGKSFKQAKSVPDENTVQSTVAIILLAQGERIYAKHLNGCIKHYIPQRRKGLIPDHKAPVKFPAMDHGKSKCNLIQARCDIAVGKSLNEPVVN